MGGGLFVVVGLAWWRVIVDFLLAVAREVAVGGGARAAVRRPLPPSPLPPLAAPPPPPSLSLSLLPLSPGSCSQSGTSSMLASSPTTLLCQSLSTNTVLLRSRPCSASGLTVDHSLPPGRCRQLGSGRQWSRCITTSKSGASGTVTAVVVVVVAVVY